MRSEDRKKQKKKFWTLIHIYKVDFNCTLQKCHPVKVQHHTHRNPNHAQSFMTTSLVPNPARSPILRLHGKNIEIQ